MFHAVYFQYVRFFTDKVVQSCAWSKGLASTPQIYHRGLKILCTLEFVSHKENKAAKAERLLESALGSKSKKVLIEIKENDLKAFVYMAVPATNLKKAVPATNLKKAVPASHLKKLSAGNVVDLIVDNEEKSPQKSPN